MDLRFIDSAQNPLWKHFFSRLKVEKVQKLRPNSVFERFSHKVVPNDELDRVSSFSKSDSSTRTSTIQHKIYDLRVIMISIYFLSKSKLREKV